MPGYNKSLSRLSPPVSPPKEIERIITDIYDTLNNLSGGSLTSSSQNITITTATGGGSGTLSHPNTSGQSSVDNTGVSVIQDVTLDNFGHVTSLASKDLVDEFVPDKSNLVLQNSASGSGSLTYNQTNKQFEYTPPAAATGDITEIVTNTNSGLSGGTTSGSATLSLNISNLVDMTDDVAAIDEIAILDGTTNKRKPLGEIDISVFNNDSGFITSATGDITGVTAGAGLTGGGTSGTVTVSHSDTSSQASVDNSNGSVIQDVTIDTYGHVTGLASVDLDSRYLRLSAGGTIADTLSIDTSSASSGNILRLLGSAANIEFAHTGQTMTFSTAGTITTTGSNDLNLVSAQRVAIDASHSDGLSVDANITCTSDISASNLNVAKVTASTGILFGSDTAAANTLDDYEEGTWTPVYGASIATVTSSTYDSGVTFGQYTKIGDTVHLWGRIRTDQLIWSSSSGSVFITGIPFSANNVIGDDVLTYAGSIAYANNWTGEHPMHLGIAGGSNNRIFLYYQEIHFDSNNGGYLNISPLDTNASTDGNDLVFQITYKV